MNEKKTIEEIRSAVKRALHFIAPDADLEELNPDSSLQEEIELDSMDFLRFLQELNVELKVEIPEEDSEKLTTLNNCVAYFDKKINHR